MGGVSGDLSGSETRSGPRRRHCVPDGEYLASVGKLNMEVLRMSPEDYCVFWEQHIESNERFNRMSVRR